MTIRIGTTYQISYLEDGHYQCSPCLQGEYLHVAILDQTICDYFLYMPASTIYIMGCTNVRIIERHPGMSVITIHALTDPKHYNAVLKTIINEINI
jgi:hypothetical protein